jgi:hypothetical protein
MAEHMEVYFEIIKNYSMFERKMRSGANQEDTFIEHILG